MSHLNGISFNRYLTPPSATKRFIFCLFANTSEEALGAYAYVRRQVDNGDFDVRFIAAKSRVRLLLNNCPSYAWSYKQPTPVQRNSILLGQ